MNQAIYRHIRFRSHSFNALSLEPEAPLAAWIDRLDAFIAHNAAFFARKPIVVDVSYLELDRAGVLELVKNLSGHGIRILGLAGADPAWSCEDLPAILPRGRAVAESDQTNVDGVGETDAPATRLTANEQLAFQEIANALADDGQASGASNSEPVCRPPNIAPLVVNAPVRSGQTIYYPEGDVTVVGSIASGADVVAGGSIHIYGTLRGRAFAGAHGEAQARIFCRRLEAELLAVGEVYLTADQIETNARGRSVQAWLEHESIRIAPLD